jgi:hypothetical protein
MRACFDVQFSQADDWLDGQVYMNLQLAKEDADGHAQMTLAEVRALGTALLAACDEVEGIQR